MRGVVLDRFGLMHLIATNVCEWLNVVIQETRDDIIAVAYDRPSFIRYASITNNANIFGHTKEHNTSSIAQNLTLTTNEDPFLNLTLNIMNATTVNESWTCNVSNIITPLIRNVNPYLRPCGVEYSLLCSIIIMVIWNDICTVPGLVSMIYFWCLIIKQRV